MIVYCMMLEFAKEFVYLQNTEGGKGSLIIE